MRHNLRFQSGGSYLLNLLLHAGNGVQQVLPTLLDSIGLDWVVLAQLPSHAIYDGLTCNQLPLSDLRLRVSEGLLVREQ